MGWTSQSGDTSRIFTTKIEQIGMPQCSDKVYIAWAGLDTKGEVVWSGVEECGICTTKTGKAYVGCENDRGPRKHPKFTTSLRDHQGTLKRWVHPDKVTNVNLSKGASMACTDDDIMAWEKFKWTLSPNVIRLINKLESQW